MEDLSKKEFDKLVVIGPGPSKRYKNGKSYRTWECLCKCGKTVYPTTSKLKSGHTRSCGCLRLKNISPRLSKDHPAWKGCGDISGSHWCRILANARHRKIEVSITIEYAWNLYLLQDRKCKLSGVPIDFSMSSKELVDGLLTASLDRIDSSKGYIEGNVQWVHRDVNYMKMNLLEDRFIDWCNIISNFQKEKL